MTYQLKNPVDTSKYAPLGLTRLNIEATFPLELIDLQTSVSGTGKQSLDYHFEVIDGPHKGQRHIESFYVFEADKEKQQMAARFMCTTIRALNDGQDGVFSGPDLIGKVCKMTRIQDGEYNGRPQYKSINWEPLAKPAVQARQSVKAQPAVSSQAPPAETETGDDPAAEDVPW